MKTIHVKVTDSEYGIIEKYLIKKYCIYDKSDSDYRAMRKFAMSSLLRLHIMGVIYSPENQPIIPATIDEERIGKQCHN